MVKLIYTKPAITDLKNIFHYISIDSEFNAHHFTNQLRERVKTLKTYPEKGRPLFPDKFPGIRQVLFKSYRIIYEYTGSSVIIHVITHQSRLLSNIEAIKPYII